MTQSINLYQSMFRPRRTVLSAMAMLQVLGVVVVALGLFYAYAQLKMQPIRAQAQAAATQVPEAEARVERLRAEYPPPVESPAVRAEWRRKTEKLAHTREIATKLRSGAYGSIDGLSVYLEGFARQHVEGTWLTRVRVRSGGSTIGLDGRALLPDLVPAYLDRLSREAVFRGKAFSSLELSTEAAELDEIVFSVRTSGLPKEDGS